MYDVVFYRDIQGREPTLEYIQELGSRIDKNSRVNFQKIRDYVKYLQTVGVQAKEPFAKRLDGEIWEIRPIRNRLLYAALDGNCFIILHHFIKKTQKTPKREIDQAKRNLSDYRERSKK